MTKIVSFKTRHAAVLIGLFLSAGALQAGPVSYTYTGNLFTNHSLVYTAQDSITATLTLSQALGADLVGTFVTPTSYSVFDGVQTFTDQSPGVGLEVFQFWTDALGAIVQWDVAVGISPTNSAIETLLKNGSALDFAKLGPNTNSLGTGFVSGHAGSWTATAVTALPEPTSVTLVGGALLAGVAGLRRKRRQAA